MSVFHPPMHPLTIRLLDQLLPDEHNVKDFCLKFPVEGVATMVVEFALTEEDVEEVAKLTEEYELHAITKGARR